MMRSWVGGNLEGNLPASSVILSEFIPTINLQDVPLITEFKEEVLKQELSFIWRTVQKQVTYPQSINQSNLYVLRHYMKICQEEFPEASIIYH